MSFITSPGVIFPPLTAGGVAYGTGSQAKVNTAGILGQYLISGGAGVPTFTNLGTFTTVNCTNLVSSGTAASSFTVTSGTAVPLRITNVGTGNSFVVEDSANPDATPFVIDAFGNVIVGTTAPIVCGGVATSPVYQEHGLTNNLSSIGLTNWSSTAARTPSLNFNRSLGNAIGTRAGITVAGTAIGALSFSGDDGTNWLEAARIEVFLDATGGVNDMPGRLVFSTTADGASTPTERMRIDSAGAVGIGAATIAGIKLSISGTASGATSTFGLFNSQTVDPAVSTSVHVSFGAAMTVLAGTLPDLRVYNASQGTFTGTVTNQYGFFVQGTLTGATNNYAVYSNIPAAANRFNFYAAGTAINYFAGVVQTNAATAIPAGGTAGAGVTVSSTANFGVFFGSGAPTLTAAKGSLYLRSDGTTVNDRMYVNTNGSTTWTNVVTAA